MVASMVDTRTNVSTSDMGVVSRHINSKHHMIIYTYIHIHIYIINGEHIDGQDGNLLHKTNMSSSLYQKITNFPTSQTSMRLT